MYTVFRGANGFETYVASLKTAKTLIICGLHSAQSPNIADAISVLQRALNDVSVYSVTENLPLIEAVPNVQCYEQIIAIGGGKIMDIAKIAALDIPQDVLRQKLRGGDYAIPRSLPLVCIPITCGSGSEATSFAVCYMDGQKYSITHPSILPDVAILNADFLVSQSNAQIKAGALDGLCQSMESVFSKSATVESIAHSKKALELGFRALRQLAKNDVDYDAFQTVSHLSGVAINTTKTNIPHALSYYLTLHHDIPHGFAVAFFYEGYLQMLQQGRDQLTDAQKDGFECICRALCNSSDYKAGSWRELLSDIALPNYMNDLEKNIDQARLRASVNVERLQNFALEPDLDMMLWATFNG